MSESKKMITFHIRKFNPEHDAAPAWKTFSIPLIKGMTVLDGLHTIKQTLDPGLAWRYSCRMGVCGSCAMLINGKPTLACNTQVSAVSEKEICVGPLPNFNTVRDLVPDLTPMFEKHQAVKPFILRKDKDEMDNPSGEYEQTPHELEAYLQFSYCIRCGACMAACPTMATDRNYPGPMPLAQSYRYTSDTRDDGSEERSKAVDRSSGVFSCHFGSECSAACPKGVDPAKAIQLMKRRMVWDYLRLLKRKKPCGVIHGARTTGRRENIPEPPEYTVPQK
jgi:succinate dehydrogenase / fumarate reductase iron-sulfur subunit